MVFVLWSRNRCIGLFCAKAVSSYHRTLGLPKKQATEFVEGLQRLLIVPQDLQCHSRKTPSWETTTARGRTGDPAFRLIVHQAASRSRIGLPLMIRFVGGCSQGDEVAFGEEF